MNKVVLYCNIILTIRAMCQSIIHNNVASKPLFHGAASYFKDDIFNNGERLDFSKLVSVIICIVIFLVHSNTQHIYLGWVGKKLCN